MASAELVLLGRLPGAHEVAQGFLGGIDEARQVIGECVERYNREWLLGRHSYRTPAEVRASFRRQAA